jgi:hypothetical protein
MTGPIRSNPGSRTAGPSSSAQVTAATAEQPRTASVLSGEPGLPIRPGAPQAGERTSSTTRARLPAPGRTPASAAGASHGAIPTPAPARLAQAAQRLAELEQRRAAIAVRLGEAKQARQASAGKAQNNALAKLQDRIDHATGQLQRTRVDRSIQLGKLEKAERLLASCERQFELLSIEDEPTEPAEKPGPSHAQVRPAGLGAATSAKPPNPQEANLQRLINGLEKEAEAAHRGKADAQQALVAARARVQQAEAAAALALTPAHYVPLIEGSVTAHVNHHLESHGLQPIDRLPPPGQPDARFTRYLERFTEVGADGRRRLNAATAADPGHAFSAVGALYAAWFPAQVINSLLQELLAGEGADTRAIDAALRAGGDGLEAAVRSQVGRQWGVYVQAMQGSARSREASAQGPRHERIQGVNTRRSEKLDMAERSGVLVQLQADEGHRRAIIEGAVSLGMSLLGGIVHDQGPAQEAIARAKAALEDTKASLRPAFAHAIQADQALHGPS